MKPMRIINNYKLAKLSTFKIGGKAEYFCSPKNIDEIKEAIKFSNINKLNLTILGGGANILISDSGIKGLVISMNNFKNCFIKENVVVADAGISIKELNKSVLANSLTGLEFTGGLPGSLGGAVYMNARAYNREMSGIVTSVCAINKNLEIINLSFDELNFDYKKSIFMENESFIILYVTLKLEKGIKKEIVKLYKKNIEDRKSKKQFDFPSAGCVFKNDYGSGVITGKLIDELGLKGLKIGGAEVFKHHGNFIINKNHAKANDVKMLIEKIEEIVYEKRGIKLEREIRLLGF